MRWLLVAVALTVVALVMQAGLVAFAGYVLLGVYVLSRYLARRWAEDLSAERKCSTDPREVGDAVEVSVTLRNAGAIPILWVLVEDLLPEGVLRRPTRLEVKGKRVRVVGLGAKKSKTIRYTVTFRMRGCYPIGPTVLETGDVFGLHRRHRVAGTPAYVMVYPKIVLLTRYDFASQRPIGEVRLQNRLFEDVTRTAGVRPYIPGDPLSRVHWRATARTGQLHSRLYEPTSLAGATILLDFHADGYPKRGEPVRSDLAVTTACSLAYAVSMLNQQIGLVSNGRDAAGRSATESHLAGLIASKGPDALPQDILSGIDVLDPRVRPGLAQRLKLMEPLVQHGPWMSDCLQNPGPVFMILESTTMPQDLLLPFQAVSMASLGRPLSDGSDPYRWLFVDERAKLAHNAIIAQTDRTQSREHRHGRTAVCANAQEVSSFDEAFISNATIVAIGKMNNQNEIKLAQTYYGPLRDVSMKEFMSLENGEFIIAAPNNTGKHQVYRVKIRPTVLHAGGETLRL
mgnify:CR=1 FL=1